MIIVFDLDDTLFCEYDYVKSGFVCVSKSLSAIVHKQSNVILNELLTILQHDGRGEIFNTYLTKHGIYSKKLVNRMVTEYRKHRPNICLTFDARATLEQLQSKQPLYLVTDGNKIVQENKIVALGLKPYFKRIFITHRFGLAASKPSLHCFEIIKHVEGVDWEKIIYIGDDPNKDFINLKKVGAKTIRLRVGRFKNTTLDSKHEAQWEITRLSELPELLDILNE